MKIELMNPVELGKLIDLVKTNTENRQYEKELIDYIYKLENQLRNHHTLLDMIDYNIKKFV